MLDRLLALLAHLLWGPATTGQSLALVIPVHNDPDGLARVLAQARAFGVFAQIVVVDDGSDPPVPDAPDITLIRHASARGGGVARNRGLRAVRTDYVLFFDADDTLTDDLPHLLADLTDHARAPQNGPQNVPPGEQPGTPRPFDMCLFKHADSRMAAAGLWGQPDWDEVWWQAAGIGPAPLSAPPRAVWPLLAQTANYPWNKILRTRFLRRHRIGCAPTPVHQDIPLHWLAFVHARHVLVSDRICALHHVSPSGGRLTNRNGPERMAVFDALAPVQKAVAKDPVWRAALAQFAAGLFDWIADRVDAATAPRFAQAARAWQAGYAADWPKGADNAADATDTTTGDTAPPIRRTAP